MGGRGRPALRIRFVREVPQIRPTPSVRETDALTLAQHFSAGPQAVNRESVKQTAENFRPNRSRPFHGLSGVLPFPSDKSLGYCQASVARTPVVWTFSRDFTG
jgi:hypothetical protein